MLKKYQSFINKNILYCNKIVENKRIPVTGARKQLDVPLKQQSNYYYCGPASLRWY